MKNTFCRNTNGLLTTFTPKCQTVKEDNDPQSRTSEQNTKIIIRNLHRHSDRTVLLSDVLDNEFNLMPKAGFEFKQLIQTEMMTVSDAAESANGNFFFF